MKDHIGDRLKECRMYNEILAIVDDWMDYYNNDRYQYITTGIYPLKGKIPSADMENEEGD